MGCGKSAISRGLSKELLLKNIDLDDYIEEKEQKSISEIFETKGEIYFRKIETNYLKELLDSKEHFILSLGGGTPCFGKNMNLINQKGVPVYLSANVSTLVKRLLPEKTKRPLIARVPDDGLTEFIGKHLFERNQFYSQAATKVTVDSKSVFEIVKEIATIFTT